MLALTFALPAVGRAVSVSPAALFRGVEGLPLRASRANRWATALVAAATLVLLVLVLPG